MSANIDNPTGFLVIRKKAFEDNEGYNPICCPVTNAELKKYNDAYFSKESLLAYPILGGIPCLTKQAAIRCV